MSPRHVHVELCGLDLCGVLADQCLSGFGTIPKTSPSELPASSWSIDTAVSGSEESTQHAP